MKNVGIALGFGALIFTALSFTNSVSKMDLATKDPKVQWMSFEEAVKKSQTAPRKIMIDLYTNWCGWCKRMDKDTFEDEDVANYLNENYYNVKFDAEYKEDIIFNGQTYKYVKNGRRGYHELAAELANGRLSFPTTVFLDEKQRLIQPLPGYKEPDVFEQIITYFGEDMHKKMPWEKYQRTYKKKLNLEPIEATPVKN
ncbi:MAG: thioredoxin-related protein [Paraglaciecola sp.]|jgi:thioredoxin-related protein